MTTTNGIRIIGWGALAALLAVPAVAMRFTDEVRWTALDFVTVAVLLALLGLGVEAAARLRGGWRARTGAALACFTGIALVWVNLAVGIIGSEHDDANLLYAGVLAVAVGGAMLARGQAAGLARAMLATAGCQVAVGSLAVAARWGTDNPIWPRDVIGASALFTALWLACAALFASVRPVAGPAIAR